MAHPELPLRMLLLGSMLASCTPAPTPEPTQLPLPQITTVNSTETNEISVYSCVDISRDNACAPQDDIMLPNIVFEVLVENDAVRIEAWLKTDSDGKFILAGLEGTSIPLAQPIFEGFGEAFCLADITSQPKTFSIIYDVCTNPLPGGEEVIA